MNPKQLLGMDEIKLFIQQTPQEQKKKWQKERSGAYDYNGCPQCGAGRTEIITSNSSDPTLIER